MTKAFLNIQTEFKPGSEIFEALAREPLSDRPAFREIANALNQDLLRQMLTVSPEDSVATDERKGKGPIRRSGSHGTSGSRVGTMVSSGASMAHLEQRSTDVSAAVKRGNQEWWLFLHDRGKGYAYWTVDGRKGRGKKREKGARDEKRAAERKSGVTMFPERSMFFIPPGTREWALERIAKAVEDGLQRAADAAAR